MTYCANDPCENEAVKAVIHIVDDAWGRPTVYRTPLCRTCATAYNWGQAHPDAQIVDIDEFVPLPERKIECTEL